MAAVFMMGTLVLASQTAPANSSTDKDEGGAADPLQIVVSLKKQRLDVYRGAERISSTRVSTGKPGHRTPAGVFSILQKRKWHRSNIYSNAPMPYMQRLTWSGIALHEGHVPGYPASHGCIRLPGKFARQLFSTTNIGAHVVVTQDETSPSPLTHPGLLQPRPLTLLTMDEREGLLNWTRKTKPARYWVPLPVRSADRSDMTSATAGKDDNIPAAAKKLSPEEASLRMADLEYDLEQLKFYAKKSSEPLRILITQRQGPERVRDVQRLLAKLGYDPGPVDGYRGEQTRTAIKAFEEAKGIEATGEMTPAVINALYQAVNERPAPTGHLYVRQGFDPLFDAPISILDAQRPLGTHLYSVLGFEPSDNKAKWLAMTADATADETASSALNRIAIPDAVRERLEKLLTPGSSLIISDGGLGPLTSDESGFVVLIN
ncbi:MAG: L,D-transpeptidase family protein [Rhodomicrobiaceae bacterium]